VEKITPKNKKKNVFIKIDVEDGIAVITCSPSYDLTTAKKNIVINSCPTRLHR
jgi:hypothetical protein